MTRRDPPAARPATAPAPFRGPSLDRLLEEAMSAEAEEEGERWATSGSPLLAEYLELMGDGVAHAPLSGAIGAGDALLVIDMQNDFVPCSPANPTGGKFGVPEGDAIAPPIAELISFFMQRGASVVATRDYHPHDHASFMGQGGPFPAHCVQGSEGSKFRPVISRALSAAMTAAGADKVVVAFKAMHEVS